MNCHSSIPRQDFNYVLMKDYTYTAVNISAGTEISLLAYSGSGHKDKKGRYYYQFLGINHETMDTVRILASMISTQAPGEDHKTYTVVSQYDPYKRITTAYFYPPDSTQALMEKLSDSLTGKDEINTEDANTAVKDSSPVDEYVIVNKSMPVFSRKYKTAIGLLHFKELPW